MSLSIVHPSPSSIHRPLNDQERLNDRIKIIRTLSNVLLCSSPIVCIAMIIASFATGIGFGQISGGDHDIAATILIPPFIGISMVVLAMRLRRKADALQQEFRESERLIIAVDVEQPPPLYQEIAIMGDPPPYDH